jgi:DNA-binding response OmpR family regulator
MSTKILLLEDDKLLNETLQDFLEEEGIELYTALDPYTALDLTYEHLFDLYLFDVNLPYESGFDLLERLRESGDLTPAIFLTSREDKASLTRGFGVGADDYMKKPIDLDELLLRIEALLRRQTRSSRVQIDDYFFDILNKKLYHGEHEIEVSIKVLHLLQLFLEAQGSVVSFELIKDRLWSSSQEASDGALRVYITQLKKYFAHRIKNVRGVGYEFILD